MTKCKLRNPSLIPALRRCGPPPPLPGPRGPRGDRHPAASAAGPDGQLRDSPNPGAWAGGGLRAAMPLQMRSTARLPVGLRSPARGANHLCHTVTIILHKIIIKNPNFSASNPASGLLAFFSAGVCRPVITALITSVWGLPPRARNQALIIPARGPGAGGRGPGDLGPGVRGIGVRGPGSWALDPEERIQYSLGVAGSGSGVLGVRSESRGRAGEGAQVGEGSGVWASESG